METGKKNSIAIAYPKLVQEWDYEKNSPLTPDDVTVGSGKKVWWICDKGHKWKAAVYSRTVGCGCPICSGNQVLAGFNDFATLNPEASKFWDYQKNGDLRPDMVAPNSRKIVWWKCDKEHEWKASVASQNKNVNTCPYCSNKAILPGFNDLCTTNPLLLKEWNTEKNGSLNPHKILPGSHQKVWWKCINNHEWQAPVSRRVAGSGCPFCSGRIAIKGKNDLASTNPSLAKEWNYDKNGSLIPENVKAGSNKRVWWICDKGHEWQATINSRSFFQLGCPYCSNKKIIPGFNDLSTVAPSLAKEWNYDRNGDLKPTDISCGSGKKVWWICDKGHEWQAGVGDRYNGNGCPVCSKAGSSMPEQGIAYYLSQHFEIEQRTKISDKEVDIYLPCFNIGIEYDGAYYHQNLNKDMKKDAVLQEAGIKLIRVKEYTSNCIMKDGSICYLQDNMGKNYEWALSELLKQLSELTGDNSFSLIDVNIKRDRLKIRERFSLIQKTNSLEAKYPELIQQWNRSKNGILKPDMFSYGSKESVWWVCDKGHEWQASITNRIKGRGCPVCNNRIIIPGINDLQTVNPTLAKEWDFEKNGKVKPNTIAPNARLNAWWICPKCKGEYQSWVFNRARGIGCPYCSVPAKMVLKGYNDLATKYPQLIEEWDYSKNTDLKPDAILPGSNKKVWWKCKKGHEWEASVAHRVAGRKCPYCAGKRVLKGYNDLESCNPMLAKEWDFEKNTGLTPEMVTSNSNRKVWWKCGKGHEWSATIYNRNKGAGCPYCYRELKKDKKSYK